MTLVPRSACLLLVLALLGGMGYGDAPFPGSLEPITAPRVALPLAAPPDTLRTSAEPGRPLILTLPAELRGQSVERYSLLQGPALSGVAGRSFTWIPQGAEPGMHEALFRIHTPEAPADTLVLRIELQS